MITQSDGQPAGQGRSEAFFTIAFAPRGNPAFLNRLINPGASVPAFNALRIESSGRVNNCCLVGRLGCDLLVAT